MDDQNNLENYWFQQLTPGQPEARQRYRSINVRLAHCTLSSYQLRIKILITWQFCGDTPGRCPTKIILYFNILILECRDFQLLLEFYGAGSDISEMLQEPRQLHSLMDKSGWNYVSLYQSRTRLTPKSWFDKTNSSQLSFFCLSVCLNQIIIFISTSNLATKIKRAKLLHVFKHRHFFPFKNQFCCWNSESVICVIRGRSLSSLVIRPHGVI